MLPLNTRVAELQPLNVGVSESSELQKESKFDDETPHEIWWKEKPNWVCLRANSPVSIVADDKVFIVSPRHGMCNRIKAIASALRLANDSGRIMLMDWNIEEKHMKFKFEDYFQHPDVRSIDSENMSALLKERSESYEYCDWEVETAATGKITESPAMMQTAAKDFTKSLVHFRLWGNIYSCEPLNDNTGLTELLKLGPSESVKKELEGWLSDNLPAERDYPVIGIHYRGWGDPVSDTGIGSNRYANFQSFIMEMQSILREHPAARFFLATDEESCAKALTSEFGDKVISLPQPSVSSRHIEEGFMHSCKDFWCLTRTDWLIGSAKSSFSQTAAAFTKYPEKFHCIATRDPDFSYSRLFHENSTKINVPNNF